MTIFDELDIQPLKGTVNKYFFKLTILTIIKRLYRLILFQISKYVVIVKVLYRDLLKPLTQNTIFKIHFLTNF